MIARYRGDDAIVILEDGDPSRPCAVCGVDTSWGVVKRLADGATRWVCWNDDHDLPGNFTSDGSPTLPEAGALGEPPAVTKSEG